MEVYWMRSSQVVVVPPKPSNGLPPSAGAKRFLFTIVTWWHIILILPLGTFDPPWPRALVTPALRVDYTDEKFDARSEYLLD